MDNTASIRAGYNLRTFCSEVVVLVASAFVLSIASPGFMSANGVWPFAFIALIPVFAVIRHTSWKVIWLFGFLFGFIFQVFFSYWLKSFHALAIVLIPVIKAFEMMLCFIALKAADSFFKRFGYVVQAIIWVAYAYLSESWFAGFSYGNIAYAFYSYTWFVQIADITGIWGIAFLAILPQPFLGRFLCDAIGGASERFSGYLRRHVVFIAVYAVLLASDLIYGAVRTSEWRAKEPRRRPLALNCWTKERGFHPRAWLGEIEEERNKYGEESVMWRRVKEGSMQRKEVVTERERVVWL